MELPRLLIIDDEKNILDLLEVVFKKEGYDVTTCLSAPKALEYIKDRDFDLILTDIKMPETSGMQILQHVKRVKPETPVIMITAFGTIKQSVEALQAGARNYIVKPFDVEELKIIVAQGLERKKLREENILLKRELKERDSPDNMLGKSKEMQEVNNLVEKIAATDSTVLITGESGTGKEIAARNIHSLSGRRDKPFVSINCGALPENLLESELFGHVKGAFTGAVLDKKGMFEMAESGTLFLDEIGEMSSWTQVKVLRALQDRKIRRVGGTEETSVDVRIVSATNKDLKAAIDDGSFREDLFYRLNVISLEMPPLRKRIEDIPLLINHFFTKSSEKLGRKMKRIIPETMDVFESYHWPGNVRELENVVERIVAIEERETITRQSLPQDLLLPRKKTAMDFTLTPDFDLNETLDEITKAYINKALDESRGNLKEASRQLRINYRSFRYLLEKHHINPVRARRD